MPRAELVDVAVDRDTGRRTLVAKRRFEAGEVLATDTPLIVWSQAEAGLLKAFQASEDQETILSLYSPALDRQDEKIDDRRKKAASLARTKAFSSLEKDQILKVLLIGDAFAHQFKKQSALYATASAMRHDCAPNCRFRSTPDGSIEVTSIRHIPAGETLSFSYIGVTWVQSTQERRKLLRESFEFFCVCRRCQAPDVLRSAPCPGCGNFCSLEEPIAPPQGPSSIFWHCTMPCPHLARRVLARNSLEFETRPPTTSSPGRKSPRRRETAAKPPRASQVPSAPSLLTPHYMRNS